MCLAVDSYCFMYLCHVILDFHREIDFCFFLVLGFLHGVRCEFDDEISETAVGSIYTNQWKWDPQQFPKRLQQIHVAHHAKTPKPTRQTIYV